MRSGEQTWRRDSMQPICEAVAEDVVPETVKRKRKRQGDHSDSFPLTVMCWILGVAAFDLIIGLLCTGFFKQYTALLIRLSQG